MLKYIMIEVSVLANREGIAWSVLDSRLRNPSFKLKLVHE